jgi:LAO/AO transport system kinase
VPLQADAVGTLVERALAGDRGAVARLISLVESGGAEATDAAARLYPESGGAYTVGLTGAPGSGKSTLTDRLIGVLRGEGARVGVLAIDPTSPFTGGAILGDRVRMHAHATDEGVFIRSMATRGHLGGLALATPQAIRILDAVGMPWVLVETVGVGQVEVEIAEAADTTVVVVNPGWGDGVQANKAGLLEIADVFVVNKADRPGVEDTVRDLTQMLDLSVHGSWTPPVVTTIATEGVGIDELYDAIRAHRQHLERDGELGRRREARVREEIRSIVAAELSARAEAVCTGPVFDDIVDRVQRRELDPYRAAGELLPSGS